MKRVNLSQLRLGFVYYSIGVRRLSILILWEICLMIKLLGEDKMLGLKQAVRYLGVTKYQMKYWLESGQVKPSAVIETGKSVRRKFSVQDLDKIKSRLWPY